MEEIEQAELSAACRSGTVVDGKKDGQKRIVKAALVRKCCHELHGQAESRALRLSNAVVIGCLDLTGLTVPFPLRFDGCEFDTAPMLEGAQLFGLSLTNCSRLPGLLGNGLQVHRDLDLSGSRISGAHRTSASTSRPSAVWRCESEIGGRLLCVDTIIDGQGGRAIHADRMQVGSTIRLLHQFTSNGEVRLIGARIGGSFDLTGAHIRSSDSLSLDLANVLIEGNVYLIEDPSGRRPEIYGRIDMGSTHISSGFHIRNATLETGAETTGSIYARPAASGKAISAARLSVGAELSISGRCDITGMIDLAMADISSMSIGKDCVLRAPGRTALNLTNAGIRALLRLDQNAVVEGTLQLNGAVIHGTLALQ